MSTMIVALVQVELRLLGRYGYGDNFPISWAALAVALAVGIASFTAMSVAMSTMVPNEGTAVPATGVILFTQLLLLGNLVSFERQLQSGNDIGLRAGWPPRRTPRRR